MGPAEPGLGCCRYLLPKKPYLTEPNRFDCVWSMATDAIRELPYKKKRLRRQLRSRIRSCFDRQVRSY